MLILDCFEPPSYQGAENIYSHLKRFYLARQSKQQSIPLGWARPFCTPSNSSGHSPCRALRDLRLKWKSRVMGMSVQSDSSSVKLKFGGHTDTYPNVRIVSSQLLPLLPNACHGLSAQLDLAITQREMLISKVAVADSLSVPWCIWLKQMIDTKLWEKLVWGCYGWQPMNK